MDKKKMNYMTGSKFLCFMGIFILVFVFISNVFQMKWLKNDHFTTQAWDELDELAEDSVDVVFLGTSQVYSGIDPFYMYENTGITAYDISSSQAYMDVLYLALEDFFKSQSPEVAVLDMSSIHYQSVNDETKVHFVTDQLSLTDKAKWEYAFNNNTGATASDILFPLFRYHSRWTDLNQQDFDYVLGKYETTDLRGHYVSYKTVAAEFLYDLPDKNEDEFAISEYQQEYLDKIIELCEGNDCELLMIKIPNPDWRSYYSDVVQKFADSRGITYVDFYPYMDVIGIDPSEDYRDTTDHLNQKGAEKMTAYMAQYLEEHYTLEDHRSEYTEWNTELERYNAYKKKIRNIYIAAKKKRQSLG